MIASYNAQHDTQKEPYIISQKTRKTDLQN